MSRLPPSLPDLLRPDLDIVFVGINPSRYSVEHGHYFARPGNRFWPALSRSTVSEAVRAALGKDALGPTDDRALAAHGIGFTDLVKRPTVKASELSRAELAGGVATLVRKLERNRPRIACFHGITGYRHVHDQLAGSTGEPIALGLQALRIGSTRLFLAPNPSGANAHFSRDDQVRSYDTLAAALTSVCSGRRASG